MKPTVISVKRLNCGKDTEYYGVIYQDCDLLIKDFKTITGANRFARKYSETHNFIFNENGKGVK